MTDKKRKASKERAKKAAIVTADAVVEEAADLIPFGQLAYAGVKQLAAQTIDFFRDRNRIRLEQFIEGLARGVREADRPAFFDELGSRTPAEDFGILAKHVLDDEEDEKVAVYVELMRGLITLSTEAAYRRHILKAARALSVADLRLLVAVRGREKEFEAKSGETAHIHMHNFVHGLTGDGIARQRSAFSL